jgi:beta-N-acetylhexosaminidase
VFAPVADLDDGPASGVIGDRSFGSDPQEVAASAGAFAEGIRSTGVAVTAKHFPGHGGEGDPHAGDTVDTTPLDVLQTEDLVPFSTLVDDGAEAVMVGHVSYPNVWGDLPASLQPGAYELLRDLGFQGVAITDALGMGAVHARFGFDEAPAMAVAAGADAVLVNQGEEVEVLHAGLVDAVRDGRLDEARLDDAVRRVLALRGQPADGVVCPAA